MNLIADAVLQTVLAFRGDGVMLGSQVMSSIRSQITQSFTCEIRGGYRINIVESLPKNAVGKIDKMKLKTLWKSENL